jgi:outer membrane protein assembly factor BamB
MKQIILLITLCVHIGLLGSCNLKDKKEKPFELIWSYDYTKESESLSTVALAPHILNNQYVLMAPDEQISLLDSKDGSLIWSFEYPSSQWIGNNEFLMDQTSVYLSEHKSDEIYKLSLADGSILWKKTLPEGKKFFEGQNDGIDEDHIYIISRYREIYRFTKAGELSKIYNLQDFGTEDRARSIRVLNNQLIFSQYFRKEELDHDSGRILSIDKETEEVLWEYRTDKGGYIFEPILLEEGIIYAGVTDGPGEFVALDATNGEVIWQAPGVVSHAYTLTDSMVLVQGGITLRALDKFTGEELWNTGLKFGGGHGQENIAYLNGYVYHIHSGSMWILEANTGEIVHREGISGYLITAGEDKIFVQGSSSLRAYTAWK